ncbi:MAG: hypothetical protein ACKVS6_15545 [Planctomycetota bacterium]
MGKLKKTAGRPRAKTKNTPPDAPDSSDSLFALSIPERAVRSVLGTVGATAREVTHVMIPPAIRQTRFWNAAIERSLKMLAEGVGNVKISKNGEQEVDMARMAVGSVVDTAALVVFHISPLWLLAVVHDIAAGSRNYLDEVVHELREKGALEKDVNIDNIDHLLTVLEQTAGSLQNDVDRPPLSVDQLKESVVEIRKSLAQVPHDELQPNAAQFANDLEEASKAQGRPVREISNAVAVSIATNAKLASRAAVAGADVAARLFVNKGWRPYRDQLRSVHRLGYARYLAQCAKPITDAIVTNFNRETDTMTAKLLTGRLWKSAMAKLKSRAPDENRKKK